MSKQPQLPDGTTGFKNEHGERVCTGSMMGRSDSDLSNGDGEDPYPWHMHLVRMKMSPCGAYDNGGAYWGAGDERIGWMYIAFSRTQDIGVPRVRLFVRAIDRRSAIMQLHKKYPGKLKFHNEPQPYVYVAPNFTDEELDGIAEAARNETYNDESKP